MRTTRWAAATVMALVACLLAAMPAGAAPYGESEILGGIKWEESSKHRYAVASDLWYTSYGADGNVYGSWGDGYGFGSSTKYRLGISKLEGSPESLTGTDVYYGGTPGEECGEHSTAGGYTAGPNLGLPEKVMWMFYWNTSSCSNKGTPQEPTALAESTNEGKSWTPRVIEAWPDSAHLWPIGFLQYGPGYSGSLDGNAYIYLSKLTSSGNQETYLARVPTAEIGTLGSYQYYAGTDAAGNPEWSSTNTNAVPIFKDTNGHYTELISVVYNPGIGRYVAMANHGEEGKSGGLPAERQVGIFDSPNPWGPWTTVDYEENFDNTECGSTCLENGDALGMTFPQAWISESGLSMWGSYSSDTNGGDKGYDSLNVINGNLELHENSVSHAYITNIECTNSKGESVPVTTEQLTLENPGNLEYLDKTSRITSMFYGYEHDEYIRLRDSESTNNSADYLKFKLTKEDTVHIAWPEGVTPPSWLSSWSLSGNTIVGDRTFVTYKKSFAAGSTVTLGGADNSVANYIPFVD